MSERDLEINYPPAQVEVTGKKLPSLSKTLASPAAAAAAAGKLSTKTEFTNLEDVPNTPTQNQNTPKANLTLTKTKTQKYIILKYMSRTKSKYRWQSWTEQAKRAQVGMRPQLPQDWYNQSAVNKHNRYLSSVSWRGSNTPKKRPAAAARADSIAHLKAAPFGWKPLQQQQRQRCQKMQNVPKSERRGKWGWRNRRGRRAGVRS